jgi:hypothetical protein
VTDAEKREHAQLQKAMQKAAAEMDAVRVVFREKTRLLARAEGELEDFEVAQGLR